MRRALWVFSAPVVAGGLAWAVNAADNQSLPSARAPQAQNGQIFYFSRSGKSGSATTASTAGGSAKDADASDADDSDAPPRRYVRNRPKSTTTKAPAKNYYQDLFSESDAPKTAQAARDRAAKDDEAAPKANRQAA